MAINVAQLQTYMGAGMNILITGEAGTGKTSLLRQAADNLGWTMKYYSASTLDPFADLVGIPVPDTERREVNYYRPRDVDNAEVIFFDELNRADSKTLNAVFEIIQFRSINGEPLPKLKAVVAAMNPVTDAYDTDELDIALADRFHIYLTADVEVDYQYLKAKFGEKFARAGQALFRDYQRSYKQDRAAGNTMPYLSPRRLDIMMANFRLFPNLETLRASATPGMVVGWDMWVEKLRSAMAQDAEAAASSSARSSSARNKGAAAAQKLLQTAGTRGQAKVAAQLAMSNSERGRKSNAKDFGEAYEWAEANDPASAQNLLTALAPSLNSGVGAATLRGAWGEFIMGFNFSQKALLQKDWPAGKMREVAAIFGW